MDVPSFRGETDKGVVLYYSGSQATVLSVLGVQAIDLPAPAIGHGDIPRALLWSVATAVGFSGMGARFRPPFLKHGAA